MKSRQSKRFKAFNACLVASLLVFVFGLTWVFPQTVYGRAVQPVFPTTSGMQVISDGVFASTGENIKVNMGLIVSGNEAAIIDTGTAYEGYDPQEAIRVKQYLEANNLKLKYIFLTHGHIDHIGNLAMFEASDVVIYDYSNTTDGQLINFGDKSFRVLRTNGHYNDRHISIELVKENLLFAGDVIVTNLPTVVGFDGNFKGLVPTLEMLRTKNYSIIVPGHGDIINPHEAINMNLEYLKNVEKYVTKILDDGGTLDDVLQIKLEDCMKNTEILDQVNMQEVHQLSLTTAYYEFLNAK